jgi:hypothetical protein
VNRIFALQPADGCDPKTISRVFAHSQGERQGSGSVTPHEIGDHLELVGALSEDNTLRAQGEFDDTAGLYATTAHRIHAQAFRPFDAAETAIEEAVFLDSDQQLGTRKFVFADASFLVIRKQDFVPVDPRSGPSLWSYAKWVGYSVKECVILVTLFNLLDAAGGMLN